MLGHSMEETDHILGSQEFRARKSPPWALNTCASKFINTTP